MTFDDAGAPGEGEAGSDGVPVAVDARGEGAGKVVLADRIAPLRETLALALGEHDGERADVPGQGVELGAVGQDGLELDLLASDSVVGRRRIQPATVRGEGGCAVTGRGEARFCRR
ncbi:hypothetical protein AB0F92_14555 [Kitasatospora aureofaciens]|uniref:hypothetical protein n=1 Tax=Kitasatospora aureofaciens TaxID=1894 RepID=UPI0033E26FEA